MYNKIKGGEDMIKLTSRFDKPLYINEDRILYMSESPLTSGGTTLHFSNIRDDSLTVKEQMEEIFKLIQKNKV